jgi:death-on-curing protein
MAADDVLYLTFEEILAVHEAAMERSGHAPTALLHPDKLVSALVRPQNAAYYEGADLVAQVAILMIALSESQAFEEGNKRTAFLAAEVMLNINGYEYAGDSELWAVRLLELASPGLRGVTHGQTITEMADYMRAQVVALPQATE